MPRETKSQFLRSLFHRTGWTRRHGRRRDQLAKQEVIGRHRHATMKLLVPTLVRRPARSAGVRSGFTLIELILVLGLLLIVAGISYPTLKNFFRGRALDSEARRFLSLTRYAQSRAAAEGLPM